MKKWNILFSFLGLSFILSGTFLCFKDSFRLDWWDIRHILIRSFGVSCFVGLIYQKRNMAFSGILATVLGSGFVIIARHELFRQECINIYNQVVGLMNKYYMVNFVYIKTSKPYAGDSHFMLVLVLLFGLWLGIWCVAGKLKTISLLPVSIPIIAGLLLGYPPSVRAIVLLLCGIGLLYGKKQEGEQKAITQGRTLALSCMAAAVLLSLAFLKPASEKLLGYYEGFIEFQLSLEDRGIAFMEERGWNFSKYAAEDLSKAILSNKAPKLTDENMFRVTINTEPLDIIYITKFTGGVYQDGRWEADLMEGEFPSEEATASKNTWEGYLTIDENGNYHQTIMEIELMGESENVRLLPANREYRWEWEEEYEGDFQKQAVSVYTKLPEHGLERMRAVAQAFGMAKPKYEEWQFEGGIHTSPEEETEYIIKSFPVLTRYYEEEVEKIESFIQKDTYYSLNLKSLPTGADFAEHFLFEQKKGFCIHYATAGTLLLRAMGIPARYVSGYIIMPSDFKENGDGTYTAVVKKKRAHAWAEMLKGFEYDAGMAGHNGYVSDRNNNHWWLNGGSEDKVSSYWWEIVELTPPAYTNTLRTGNPETALSETVENVEQRMREEREKENPEGEARTNPASAGNTNETENENTNPADIPKESSGIEKAGKTIAAIFAAMFTFRLLLPLRRWILLSKRKKRFLNGDTRKAALYITRQTLRTLEALGYEKREEMSEPEYGAYIQRTISCFSEGEFPNFISIAQMNAYSNRTITEGQRNDMHKTYEKLLHYSKVEVSVTARKMFYWKYILVLF